MILCGANAQSLATEQSGSKEPAAMPVQVGCFETSDGRHAVVMIDGPNGRVTLDLDDDGSWVAVRYIGGKRYKTSRSETLFNWMRPGPEIIGSEGSV